MGVWERLASHLIIVNYEKFYFVMVSPICLYKIFGFLDRRLFRQTQLPSPHVGAGSADGYP